MINYEKELFDRFLSEGTFVVNNVLKRNILKLRYITMPDDFRDDRSRKEPSPPTNLSRMQKNPQTQQSRSKSSSVMGAMTPRRSIPHKSKFNVLSTAIQWMTSRHDTDNPDLALAEKLVRASASTTSLRSIGSRAHHHRDSKAEFKITQAKCKFSIRLECLVIRKHPTLARSPSSKGMGKTEKRKNIFIFLDFYSFYSAVVIVVEEQFKI